MTQRRRKTTAPKAKAPAQKNNGFYRAFEERFRGPRAVIKKRLKVYLPFVKPLLDHYQPAKVLDLGCGRGEWLELMLEAGFEVEGIDLDAGMREACLQLDLPVLQGDAIDHLKKQADDSHAVISAFHVVEHIAFEQLTDLIAEALRVLKPAGLLILETPNPENIVVATSSFYLDPTHLRPIPPDLLAFLPENSGFKRSKILRLQESKELSQDPSPNLLAVLNGVSPDYAVMAQKTAPQKMLAPFDEVFSQVFGLTLATLTQKYQQSIAADISTIEQRVAFTEDVVKTINNHDERMTNLIDQNTRLQVQLVRIEEQAAQQHQHNQWLQNEWDAAKAQLEQQQQHAQHLQGEWDAAKVKIGELNHSSHHWWMVAEDRQQQIDALLNSTSWRITWPLRQVMRGVKWLGRLPARFIKALLRPLLKVLMSSALKRPRLRERLSRRLQKWPTIYAHLRQLALHRGLIDKPSSRNTVVQTISAPPQQDAPPVAPEELMTTEEVQQASTEPHLANMSPRARQIYADLKAAIEQHKKEAV